MQPVPNSVLGAAPPGTAVVYMPVQMGSKINDRYKHRQSIGLGISQIIIGIICIVFNSIVLGLSFFSGLGYIGHGFWCGILFIITGSFGIAAGKKRTGCQIITFMVFCIISAVSTIFLLMFGIIGALQTRYCGETNYYYYFCTDWTSYNVILATTSCLALLGFVEAILAIWGSTLCCRSGVCCCPGQMMTVPAVGYFPDTGHMISMSQVQGGPHVYAPQSNFPNLQGQIQPSVYVQPGWTMPPTNNGPVFGQGPPSYTTSSAPPLWMMPSATTNPDQMSAQALPADPVPYQKKEVFTADEERSGYDEPLLRFSRDSE